MTLIGISAGIDAAISLMAYIILSARKQRILQSDPTINRSVQLFSSYLIWTTIFLAAIATAILGFTGPAQSVALFVADLILWVSLVYMILFVFHEKATKGRTVVLTIFAILALARSVYQLSGILGVTIFSGEQLIYALSNMDAWLMYAVWVPSAIAFLSTALTAESPTVRMRSLFLCIGLLLIAFTWAFRLLSKEPSLALVSVVSVVGFALFLSGLIYRKSPTVAQMA